MSWVSQAGQDQWVWELLGDGGFFVDVGAYDGVEHSNTFVLEREHGWSGICIEPNPHVFPALQRNRDVAVEAVVSDEATLVTFTGDHVTVDGSGTSVRAMPLRDILAEQQAPDRIDYLSIDVEGWELRVLDGMDFDRWRVSAITVEHNLYLRGPSHKWAIQKVLEDAGFVRVREDVVAPGYGPYEDWYTLPKVADFAS